MLYLLFIYIYIYFKIRRSMKSKKYKSLHGPSYLKIYLYSFFGHRTTIFIYIYIYIYK